MRKQVLMAIGIVAIGTIIALGIKSCARADEINLKQGMVMTWHDCEFKQLTSVEIAKTDINQVPNWPKWAKAAYDGWSLDLGYPWDNRMSRDAALVLGREFGTLGKYLPLNFPFKDKITITLYAAGIYAENMLELKDVKIKGCSGVGYLKGTLKF